MATYTITGFVIGDDNLNFKDTTYSNATADEAGLMSSTDKEKLDEITTINYVVSVSRPNGLNNKHIINVIAVSWSSSDITTPPVGYALVADTSPNTYVYFQNAGSLTSITLRYVYVD